MKCTLYMDSVADGTAVEESVLDFDHADLLPDERDVIESAIEDGEYTEGYVNWSDAPNGTTIPESFKSVILRLADHGRSTADRDLGTPRVSSIGIETFSTYEGTTYETRVTSRSAE